MKIGGIIIDLRIIKWEIHKSSLHIKMEAPINGTSPYKTQII